jgi:hypothetical protein
MHISATYIEEPDLVFGNRGIEKDPKIGLKYFGPYLPSTEDLPTPTQIRIGIVGTGETISLTKQVLDILAAPIKSEEENKWLYPDFPGFTVNTTIRSKFINADIWNETILSSEIKHILSISDVNNRIAAASNLIVQKIGDIALEESAPHVIIFALPRDLEEYCGISERTRGAKRPRFTELEKSLAEMKNQGQTFLTNFGVKVDVEEELMTSYDLRNSLKGKAMQFGIPTQIVRQTTIEEILNPSSMIRKTRQGAAAFAWNFSMALYYKAHGRPWRLAKLTPGTCYVGVSFYRNLLNPNLNIETSMAQVFTHSGEGFVLKGGDVTFDKWTRSIHLTKSQAAQLIKGAVKKYAERAGQPERVVIHKTSLFSEEEIAGFDEAIGDDLKKDYISISQDSGFRFLRTGKYPVLRGTLISLSSNQHLLYSTGYTPRVRTYPGPRVPKPLLVTHRGDSEISLVCSEILGLTKLNWNTTAFSTQLPITLDFARKVGKVLSELPDGSHIRDHYKFYM